MPYGLCSKWGRGGLKSKGCGKWNLTNVRQWWWGMMASKCR